MLARGLLLAAMASFARAAHDSLGLRGMRVALAARRTYRSNAGPSFMLRTGQPIRSGDGVVIAASSDPGFSEQCGWYGCEVMRGGCHRAQGGKLIVEIPPAYHGAQQRQHGHSWRFEEKPAWEEPCAGGSQYDCAVVDANAPGESKDRIEAACLADENCAGYRLPNGASGGNLTCQIAKTTGKLSNDTRMAHGVCARVVLCVNVCVCCVLCFVFCCCCCVRVCARARVCVSVLSRRVHVIGVGIGVGVGGVGVSN